MFVVTLKSKIKKPKKAFVIVTMAIILIVVLWCITGNNPKTQAECTTVGTYSLDFATDEDKESFLAVFNLKGELVTIDKVKIPSDFNEVYERYNKIQKKMGLDLEDYKGKIVARFVYKTQDGMYVSVLCYKNMVVGCHKCTDVYGDDFMALTD
jgi:hypothetical protein